MNFFEYFELYYINHIFGPTFIITELTACLAISIIFNHTDIKKWQDWLRLFLDFVAVWVLDIFFNCCFRSFCAAISNDAFNRYSGYFIWPILSFLHILYPRNDRKMKMKITCATSISIFIMLDINISGAIGGLFTQNIDIQGMAQWKDVTMYVVLALLIATVIVYKIISPFKYRFVKNTSAVLFNVICIISYAILICETAMEVGNEIFIAVLLPLLFLLIFASYANFYITVRNYNEILDLQTKALKAESEKNQIEISNTKYEELHRIRHDLKNQMAILSNLVKGKEYDELNKYFADIFENTQIVIDFVDCGNTFINAVLNMELAKAKSNKIQLQSYIVVPKELDMDASDLSSLLTNAIDNAMEYEVRNHMTDPIELSLTYNTCLLITVKNKLVEGEDTEKVLRLKSSKEDRMNHGYGTKMIKNICQKYHGIAKFSAEENCFTLDCLLMVKEKEAEPSLKQN